MNDRTRIAVIKQMTAMGEPSYEIGLKDQKTQLMMNRTMTPDEVLERLNWLKSMNAQGRHIYIRPATQHGLVLVDDLKRPQLDQLARDRLAPAAIVETSPNNFQAWIKLSRDAVAPAMRSYIAQALAKQYDGDPNSADFRHYGRLAGFTNPKPERARDDGRQPFVLIHGHSGEVALDGSIWTARALEALTAREQERARDATIAAYQNYNRQHGDNFDRSNPLATYQAMAGQILNKYGPETDLSRMDWMIAKSMVVAGFQREQIEQSIRDGSPNLSDRKASSTDNYVRHTVSKALREQAVASAGQGRDAKAEQARMILGKERD